MGERRQFDVRVNVYDLVTANRWLDRMGLGAYHSGVEVNGVEYFFGEGGGVGQTGEPRASAFGAFKTALEVGDFFGTVGELRALVSELRGQFPAEDYHLVRNNCNAFSAAMVRRLCGAELPGWLNRAASFGGALLPKRMMQRVAGGAAPAEGGAAAAPRPPLSKEAAAAAAEEEKRRNTRKTLTPQQQKLLDKMRKT